MAIILKIECGECGQQFAANLDQYREMGMAALPQSCPKCLDCFQQRPDITLERKEIFSICCSISSLPGEWQRVERPNDFPGWRMIIKGSYFGASWSGRIDLWTVAVEPPKIGDVVYLREMEVSKKVAKVRWERATLEHGTVSGYRQVPLGTENAQEYEEKREYVRLDLAPDRDPKGRELIWVKARSKTTLKGFGRQYHSFLEGNPLWHTGVSGGVRSGRENTEAWLAVVDKNHPVIRRFKENGQEELERIPADNID